MQTRARERHFPRLLLWVLLAITPFGCRNGDSGAGVNENDSALLSQVKAGLVDRDRILFAYHLEGRVLEAGREARFSFDYRAPDRMLGTLHSNGERRLAFDGELLYQLDPPLKRLTRTQLRLKPAQRAGLLTQLFSPFIPDGFRMPLLPRQNVGARRVSHPRAPQAIELRVKTSDAQVGTLELRYLLRWPSLDFLEKRTEGALRGSTVMTQEHCDATLKLCVPKILEQTAGDRSSARTILTVVSLNQPLPAEAFALTAPPSFNLIETTTQ